VPVAQDQASKKSRLAPPSKEEPNVKMLAFFPSLLATILLTSEPVAAQQYVVWSSVIFSRTGERTPEVLGKLPVTLTSLGAKQAYNAGAFFRDRYVSTDASQEGITGAPLQGLSADSIDNTQLYAEALDQQYTVASA